jgi:hypothetical protein
MYCTVKFPLVFLLCVLPMMVWASAVLPSPKSKTPVTPMKRLSLNDSPPPNKKQRPYRPMQPLSLGEPAIKETKPLPNRNKRPVKQMSLVDYQTKNKRPIDSPAASETAFGMLESMNKGYHSV